jgi:hypothetical protein
VWFAKIVTSLLPQPSVLGGRSKLKIILSGIIGYSLRYPIEIKNFTVLSMVEKKAALLLLLYLKKP